MEYENLTNLDIACKKCLTKVLRPQLYTVIHPWLSTASNKEKRQVLDLTKIATGRVHVSAQNATTVNVFGKTTPFNHNHQSLDRVQSEIQMKQCNDDDINGPLEKRRLHFKDYEPTPSGASVNHYFSLNNSPLKKEPYSKLLNSKAQQQLESWQSHSYHNDHFKRAEVVQTLRNLDRAINVLPTYTEHLARNPKLASGPRAHALHQFSMKEDYVPPMRRIESAPEVIKEAAGEDPEVVKIKQPGGYRVELTDTSKIQFLKNYERSRTCKVTMMGGSGAYQSTYTGSYPDWTAAMAK